MSIVLLYSLQCSSKSRVLVVDIRSIMHCGSKIDSLPCLTPCLILRGNSILLCVVAVAAFVQFSAQKKCANAGAVAVRSWGLGSFGAWR